MFAPSLALTTLLILGQAFSSSPSGAPPEAGQAERSEDGSSSGTNDPTVTAPPPETVALTPRNPPKWEVGVAMDVSAPRPQGMSNPPEVDASVAPIAALKLPIGPGSISFIYTLQIQTTSPKGAPTSVNTFQQARVVLDTHTSNARYFLELQGLYGRYDFNPTSRVLPAVPAPTGLPPAQQPGTTTPTQPTPVSTPSNGSLPDQRFVEVAGVAGSGGVVFAISPRFSWLASLGYSHVGGANASAQAQYPLQYGPSASTGPIWAVTPLDTFAALLNLSQTRFDYGSGPPTVGPIWNSANVTGTWTHKFSRSLEGDLVGGVAVYHSKLQGLPPATVVYGIAGLALRQSLLRPSGGWRNSFQILLAPLPDQVSGIVYQRLTGSLTSLWAVSDKLNLTATGSLAVQVPGGQQDARVEARVGYSVATGLAVSLGARAAWVSQSPLLGSSGFGWVCFLNVLAYLGDPI